MLNRRSAVFLLQIAALAVAASVPMAGPSFAVEKLGYGSRAGMTVTVIAKSGIDTDNASIKAQHTAEDARIFCRDYVGKVTPQCIKEELATPLSAEITANCRSGEFTNFYGERLRFEGANSKGPDDMAPFKIRNLKANDVADGSSASGYPVNFELFKALCPSRFVQRQNKRAGPFEGVWNATSEDGKSCKAADFEARENGGLIRVTSKQIDYWETTCEIRKRRMIGDATAEILLQCSGEGETWQTKEIWYTQSVGQKKLFVAVTVLRSDPSAGRDRQSRENASKPSVAIYAACD